MTTLPTTTPSPSTRSAFFYGTLMAPSVLKRVTDRQSTNPNIPPKPPLKIRPAILPGFRRHRVKYADYPAIVPVSTTQTNLVESGDSETATAAPQDTSSQVRGTYVTGLVASDIKRLDAFEGSEYERRFVQVQVLPPETGPPPEPESAPPTNGSNHGEGEDREEWATAETYVWIAHEDELEDREWDFDEFVRDRLYIWAGKDPGFEDAERAGRDGEGFKRAEQVGETAIDPTRGRSVNGGEFERMMSEADKSDG